MHDFDYEDVAARLKKMKENKRKETIKKTNKIKVQPTFGKLDLK